MFSLTRKMSEESAKSIDKSLYKSCICWLEYQVVYNREVTSTSESEWSPKTITTFDACNSIVTRGKDTLPITDKERDWAEYILFEIYLNKFHKNNDLNSVDWKKMPKNYIETSMWGTKRNLQKLWFGNYEHSKCYCFYNECKECRK